MWSFGLFFLPLTYGLVCTEIREDFSKYYDPQNRIMKIAVDGSVDPGTWLRFDDILQNESIWYPIVDDCPALALVARIIEAEIEGGREPHKLNYLVEQVYQLWKSFKEQGLIDEEDMAEFYVVPMFQRLKEFQNKMNVYAKSFTVTMISNFCKWEDWVGKVQNMSWATHSELTPYLSAVDFKALLVDAPHCTVKHEDFAKFLPVFNSVGIQSYPDFDKGRSEFGGYWRYIVEYYDKLPDFVVFMHPDSDEHQGPDFKNLVGALQFLRSESELAREHLAYYPLSTQYLVDPKRTHDPDFANLWRDIFGVDYDPTIGKYGFYVSCQAIVSKEKIREHPREFYKHLLHLALNPKPEHSRGWNGIDNTFTDSMNPYGSWEAIFPIIFGQPQRGWIREKKKDLPLSLRWDMMSRHSFDVV